jgi:hypothetical protein
MRSYPHNKKWELIQMDKRAETAIGRTSGNGGSSEPPPLINILTEKAGEMISATYDAGIRVVEKHSTRNSYLSQAAAGRRISSEGYAPSVMSTNTTAASYNVNPYDNNPTSMNDRSAPQYYLKSIMDSELRGVSPSFVSNLEVNLRTRPIE